MSLKIDVISISSSFRVAHLCAIPYRQATEQLISTATYSGPRRSTVWVVSKNGAIDPVWVQDDGCELCRVRNGGLRCLTRCTDVWRLTGGYDVGSKWVLALADAGTNLGPNACVSGVAYLTWTEELKDFV